MVSNNLFHNNSRGSFLVRYLCVIAFRVAKLAVRVTSEEVR